MLKIIQFESSTECQLSCKICPRSLMTREKGQMSQELFEKIISDGMAMKIEHFVGFLYGEPLMDPRLFDWMDYMVAKGLTTTIFTNGGLLTKANADKLGSYPNLTDIIVSFHGATKETYERIMGQPFEKTKQKVEYLFDTSTAPVQVYMVNSPDTTAEIGLFHKLWEGKKHFIGSLWNYSGVIPTTMGRNRSPHYCDRLMEQMVILWNGDVVICCLDFDGQVVIGNANTESLQSIWDRNQPMRDKQLSRDFDMKLCRDCNYITY